MEYNLLSEEYDGAEELPEEADQRLGEIEAAMQEFDNRPVRYDPVEIAIAGAFVTIGSDGSLSIDRGYIRPEDECPLGPNGGDVQDVVDSETGEITASEVRPTVITIGGDPVQPEEEEDDGIKPLPERLLIELTAHRTLALRDAVANNPHVAMTALLHKLVSDTFQHRVGPGVIEAGIRHVFFPAQADDLKDSVSARSITERQDGWKTDIPADDDALWDWLAGLDDTSRMALLAHCVSFGVNALYERPNPYSGSGISEHGLRVRLSQADRLARATGLDMVDVGWRPTVGNYLGRITKARILEAVREGAGERAVQLIDHMKKGDMAKEAERLLADSGWLPDPLRLANLNGDVATAQMGIDAEEEALPEFLADDAEDDADPTEAEEEGDSMAMIAAE